MWEIATALTHNPTEIDKLLREGYEPFAVTTDAWGERIWLKRTAELEFTKVNGTLCVGEEKVENAFHSKGDRTRFDINMETAGKTLAYLKKLSENTGEIHNKPKSVKGTSRRATGKPKGETIS